jgi:hypothetical protein
VIAGLAAAEKYASVVVSLKRARLHPMGREEKGSTGP